MPSTTAKLNTIHNSKALQCNTWSHQSTQTQCNTWRHQSTQTTMAGGRPMQVVAEAHTTMDAVAVVAVAAEDVFRGTATVGHLRPGTLSNTGQPANPLSNKVSNCGSDCKRGAINIRNFTTFPSQKRLLVSSSLSSTQHPLPPSAPMQET